jgi:type IV pilus assembly protein PilB
MEQKLIDREQLTQALAKSGTSRLGDTLIDLGFLSHEQLGRALAAQFELPFAALRDITFDPEAVRLLNGQTARHYQVVPIGVSGRTLKLAISNPGNVLAIDDVSLLTGLDIEPVVMSTTELDRALGRLYPDVAPVRESERLPAATEVDAAPAVRLVHRLISQAIDERASDIHLEPQEDGMRIRFRIDGLLRDVSHQARELTLPTISRIKILAGLDISERRLPQDGGLRHLHTNREQFDLRVSTLPTVLGEKVAIRILSSRYRLDLNEVGFLPDAQRLVERMLKTSYGMILVTGPTGSGKTTTLYSLLAALHTPDRNITTVEDPVEYRIEGVNQVQVKPAIGLTFATVLRALVRQDPNIIMVGEVRDGETADIAVRSALTGHLVLSSLHTNDAASTITRLVDMGVEPSLIASSVVGIIAQRLVRRICPRCRHLQTVEACAPELFALGLEPRVEHQFYRGAGCEHCSGDGYRGRMGIFEVVTLDGTLRELIVNGASTDQLRATLTAKGTRTFKDDGIVKAQQGITTLSEVLRVAYQEG